MTVTTEAPHPSSYSATDYDARHTGATPRYGCGGRSYARALDFTEINRRIVTIVTQACRAQVDQPDDTPKRTSPYVPAGQRGGALSALSQAGCMSVTPRLLLQANVVRMSQVYATSLAWSIQRSMDSST